MCVCVYVFPPLLKSSEKAYVADRCSCLCWGTGQKQSLVSTVKAQKSLAMLYKERASRREFTQISFWQQEFFFLSCLAAVVKSCFSLDVKEHHSDVWGAGCPSHTDLRSFFPALIPAFFTEKTCGIGVSWVRRLVVVVKFKAQHQLLAIWADWLHIYVPLVKF